jgi:hypothetical protein
LYQGNYGNEVVVQAVTIPPRTHHHHHQQQQQQQQEQHQQLDNEPIDVTFDSAAGLPSLNEMQNMQPRTSAHDGDALATPSPDGEPKHLVMCVSEFISVCYVFAR